MEVLACLNGETMPVEQARVPVWDRGFLFGDASTRCGACTAADCWLETEHIARLERSLKELDFPPVDLDRLMDRAHRTLQASGIEEGIVYVQITRGVAPGACVSRPARAADRADRRPALRRRADRPAAGNGRGRASAIPTCVGSAATSSRPTCWATCWRSRPPAGPVARKPC